MAEELAIPQSWLDNRRGIEDFHFPGTWRLLTLPPRLPDIVHCHNLHGGYFDLRALASLSCRLPVALTLHDSWLLTGHCAHSFGCERWRSGCGNCPDLTVYPGIKRDATAHNLRRKREIFALSRLYLATPSRWLMDRVMQSIIVPSIVDARVIPNGVDLSIFHPADRRAARAAADLPQEAAVLLVVANAIRCNTFKDYPTLRAAFARLGDGGHGEREVLVVALGEAAPPERAGRVRIRFVPYQEDPTVVANFYQAADLYVHAARADTFPTTVLEALACGTPVVATAVGGIPEQVRSMTPGVKAGGTAFEIREATGVLVQPGDSESMAGHIENLLTNSPLRDRLAQNACRDARDRFGLDRQVDTYLDWYEFMFRDFHTALKKDMRVLA